MEKLSQILQEGITKDGRYCALAIMLYTGARPAEVRALRWGDLVPFLDHPEHLLIRLHRTLDQKGHPKSTMKTTNAYRSIPVHFELAQLLNIRYRSVLTHLGKDVLSLTDRPLASEIETIPSAAWRIILDDTAATTKSLCWQTMYFPSNFGYLSGICIYIC